jgi:hypothetical protein
MAPNVMFEPQQAATLSEQANLKTEIKYVPGKGDKRFVVDPNHQMGVNW